jgi:hypothetical protein
MCTVLLPPGDNPISVNKYIISYINLSVLKQISFISLCCSIFLTHSGFHRQISSSKVLFIGQINFVYNLSECKEGNSQIAVLYSAIHVVEIRLDGMPFRLKIAVISPSTYWDNASYLATTYSGVGGRST